jgi:hypothetical protein
MTPFYHPSLGVRFWPPGSELPPGWYRTGVEAERMRHVEVPALLRATAKSAPEHVPSVEAEPINSDYRMQLMERAHAAGLKIDGRWGQRRLEREVLKAEKK